MWIFARSLFCCAFFMLSTVGMTMLSYLIGGDDYQREVSLWYCIWVYVFVSGTTMFRRRRGSQVACKSTCRLCTRFVGKECIGLRIGVGGCRTWGVAISLARRGCCIRDGRGRRIPCQRKIRVL
ncbi:hypothetical protein Hanom_Chr15g01350721 [Helianthus anomalus]